MLGKTLIWQSVYRNIKKNEDFFNVAKYTTICFVSQSIVKKGSNYEAIGHLIMNGVTKKVILPFSVIK